MSAVVNYEVNVHADPFEGEVLEQMYPDNRNKKHLMVFPSRPDKIYRRHPANNHHTPLATGHVVVEMSEVVVLPEDSFVLIHRDVYFNPWIQSVIRVKYLLGFLQ